MGNSSTGSSNFLAHRFAGEKVQQMGRSVSCFCANACRPSDGITDDELEDTAPFQHNDEYEEVFIPPKDVFVCGVYNGTAADTTKQARSESEEQTMASVLFDYDKSTEQVVICLVKDASLASKSTGTKGFCDADTLSRTSWNVPPTHPTVHRESIFSRAEFPEDSFTAHM
eukprot:GEMP01037088.1.p1 GENE.GEMP01037088.1~~GEMP01037088.1.p1  ORF type:complete len:170 (+),score=32.24 GEMP01037088.1:85-594(+)